MDVVVLGQKGLRPSPLAHLLVQSIERLVRMDLDDEVDVAQLTRGRTMVR